MKKLLSVGVAMMMLMLMMAGCSEGESSLPSCVVGQWELETVCDISGEILFVGEAYGSYDDYDGEKYAATAVFNEDGSFEITGLDTEMSGTAYKDSELSLDDSVAVDMAFDHGTEVTAVYGIREYIDGLEAESLLFTYEDRIYSFIKSSD